jgi:hypothetical protein
MELTSYFQHSWIWVPRNNCGRSFSEVCWQTGATRVGQGDDYGMSAFPRIPLLFMSVLLF